MKFDPSRRDFFKISAGAAVTATEPFATRSLAAESEQKDIDPKREKALETLAEKEEAMMVRGVEIFEKASTGQKLELPELYEFQELASEYGKEYKKFEKDYGNPPNSPVPSFEADENFKFQKRLKDNSHLKDPEKLQELENLLDNLRAELIDKPEEEKPIFDMLYRGFYCGYYEILCPTGQ